MPPGGGKEPVKPRTKARLSVGRLSALFLLLSAVPVILLTWLSVRVASDALQDEVEARVRSTASATATAVERELSGLLDLVESYAERPSLRAALANPNDYDMGQVRNQLNALIDARPGIATAFLADMSGVLIDIVPDTPSIVGEDFSFRDWYVGVRSTGHRYVSEAYQSQAAGHPRVVAGTVIVRDDGGLQTAILVAAYDLTTLQRFVDRFAASQNVDLTVTDQRGTLVAAPGTSAAGLITRRNDPLVKRALGGSQGVVHRESAGGRLLSAYQRVPTFGWAITADVPEDDALASVGKVRATVLAIAGLLGVALAGGLLLMVISLRSRRRAEEASLRLAAIVESSDDAMISKSLDGTITSWNRGAERIYGYTAEEAVGQPITLLVPAGRRDEVPDILKRIREGERVEHFETVRSRKDGTRIHVSLTVSPINNAKDEVVGASVVARDITRQKLDEAQIQRSEQRTRAIIETAGEAVVGMNTEGLITDWNRQAEATFGWSREEAIGRVLDETIIPQPFREAHRKGLERFLATGKGPVLDKRLELMALHRDGNEFPVELTISSLLAGDTLDFIAFVHDITERKEAEAALREREATLQAVFAASPDVITMIGPNLELGPPTPAVYGILGYDPEQYATMDRLTLVHPDDLERVTGMFREVLRGGAQAEIRYRVRHADGHWVVLETRAQGMTDGEGHPMGAVAVSRDVSEGVALEDALVRAKEEADRARDEAERANLAKSEFLSRMSHELRTPLNSVLGFGELLDMDDLEPDQRESVQHIMKGGRHLLDLINEVLDIARVESGRMALSLEPVSVGEVVEETVELVRPLAAEAGVGLQSERVDGHAFVRADRQRLKQVLLNLLSNAVKFNRREGGVTVRCEAVTEDQFRISVTDDGPGIAPELVDRLFVPFDRLGADREGIQGTGLGLALSKGLVEAMGGSISVESAPGTGSTFAVELTRAEPQVLFQDVGDLVPAEAGPSGRPSTLLYVEDNPANFKLIERALSHRPNVRLLGAIQGSIGVELARQHQPDLVLLDLNLPDIPGEEVLRLLQADPRTAQIPVVVLSADATLGQIRKLLAAGVVDYLTKPLEVRRFLETLDKILMERSLGHAG
jgi:PAS domain S-box-containing protein